MTNRPPWQDALDARDWKEATRIKDEYFRACRSDIDANYRKSVEVINRRFL